jgi:hypothetical protein
MRQILTKDEVSPAIGYLGAEKRDVVNEDGLFDRNTWGMGNMN